MPDFSRRAHLTELMDEPCGREELRACLRDLEKLNRWFRGYRPVLDWLDDVAPVSGSGPMRILDVGCGGGDGLRRAAGWAAARGVAVKLTGLDINPDAVAIAAENGKTAAPIEWVSGDVFAYAPEKPPHVVISSLFAHHLSDVDVVRFLRWMDERAGVGWVINDLSRAAAPYWLLKAFTRVMGMHRFVQHDGPVSIERAFVERDWRNLCAEAGLRSEEIEIEPYRPARLRVSRKKPR